METVSNKEESAVKQKKDEKIIADEQTNVNSAQDFHKEKEDSSQMSDLRALVQEMAKNVNTLMQERSNLYWNWGQQFYQQ